MAKKHTDEVTAELKKLAEQGKLVMGTERTLTKLKAGHIAKVFVSSNCPQQVRDSINHYTQLSNAEIIDLDYHNDELGTVCKKPFAISVAGVAR